MNKKKCEVCGSTHTVKNGVRKGVQLYKCQDCGHQFRAGNEVNEDAVSSIKGRGYTIRGLIIDGKHSLFKTFSEYHIQMCQFHMKQNILQNELYARDFSLRGTMMPAVRGMSVVTQMVFPAAGME